MTSNERGTLHCLRMLKIRMSKFEDEYFEDDELMCLLYYLPQWLSRRISTHVHQCLSYTLQK